MYKNLETTGICMKRLKLTNRRRIVLSIKGTKAPLQWKSMGT